jgi:hypothetical protein
VIPVSCPPGRYRLVLSYRLRVKYFGIISMSLSCVYDHSGNQSLLEDLDIETFGGYCRSPEYLTEQAVSRDVGGRPCSHEKLSANLNPVFNR